MNPLVRSLFPELVDLPPEDRDQFFVEHQVTPELRAELESLLRFDATAIGPGDEGLLREMKSLLESMAAERTPSLVGQQLFQYQIAERIGTGGMGDVYLAHDLKLGRDVAIKVLPEHFARNAERVARFRREAQVLASLNHSNIAAIYDLQNFADRQYLILELVEGETLAEKIAAGAFHVDEALGIARQIVEALEAAHDKGIVHRDLKPANIKIAPEGKVKLLDFGLAKMYEPETAPTDLAQSPTLITGTEVGVILGTVSYMSPEQARGRAVTKQTDIWAFGCVLFEMLTARRAFSGETVPDTIARILKEEPEWATLNTVAPPAVRRIVERCLQKDPRRRLHDAGDIRLELEEPLVAAPTVPVKVKSTSSKRALRYAAAAVIVLMFLLTAWYVERSEFFWTNPLAEYQLTRLTDFDGDESEASISGDGKFVAFRSDREGPFDVWVSQIGSGAFANLTKGRFAALPSDASSVGFSTDGTLVWLWSGGYDALARSRNGITVMPTLGGAPRTFLTSGFSPNWSHDGTKIVYHSNASGDPIFVADTSGNNSKQIYIGEPGSHNHFPTWSPDGRFIYVIRGLPPDHTDIWRIPSDGGEPERITNHNSHLRHLAFLDRRTLLFTSTAEDGSGPWLYSIDVERRISHRVFSGLEHYSSIAASADGQRLVATVTNPSGTIWTVPILDRVAAESDIAKLPLPTPRASVPRLAPDYLLYLSSKDAGNGLWKSVDGAVTELNPGPLIGGAAISFDGRQICFAMRKDGRLRLYLINADGTDLRALVPSLELRGTPSWSPDGKWIAVAVIEQGASRLFKIPTDGGPPVRIIEGLADSPVWSPDGSLIVYAEPAANSTYPIRAVTPEGKQRLLPDLIALRGGDRYRFLPNSKELVLLLGEIRRQDFWLLNLATNGMSRLTEMKPGDTITGFDVSPDGKNVMFDRVRENADVVLITRPTSR